MELAVIGMVLNAIWYFAIAFASAMHEIVALSLLSGLASASTISWLAYYGDSFGKEYRHFSFHSALHPKGNGVKNE